MSAAQAHNPASSDTDPVTHILIAVYAVCLTHRFTHENGEILKFILAFVSSNQQALISKDHGVICKSPDKHLDVRRPF